VEVTRVEKAARHLIWAAGALFGLGLVMVFSASSYRSVHVQGDPYLWFSRQLVWAAVAVALLLVAWRTDYRWILRQWPVLFGLTVAALVLVFVPGVGRRFNEAARWISIGGYICQPSEVAKLTTCLCLAGFLARRRERIDRFFATFLPALGGTVAYFGLILVEPDLGTAVFVFALAVVIMLIAGIRVVYLGLAGLLASPALVLFAYVRWDTIAERLKGVLDPVQQHQLRHSLIALGSGGLWGKGLGMSTQKLGFLPEPFTDFIFSVIGEELGFAGAVGVVALFAWFLAAGLTIALRSRDFGGFLLAFGVTFSVVFQAVFNLAVVSGTAPTKGISLPFVSYGGSGLALAFAQVGLILSVARIHLREQETSRETVRVENA
jgi:cell division protein FtsW